MSNIDISRCVRCNGRKGDYIHDPDGDHHNRHAFVQPQGEVFRPAPSRAKWVFLGAIVLAIALLFALL